MAGPRIRLANRKDHLALARMRYNFRTEIDSPTEAQWRFVRRCVSWMNKRFRADAPQWRCWVLADGKQLLGHISVQLFEKIPNPVNEPELHGYVTNLYVVPELRGQGFGKSLIEKALSWCHAEGTDAVILWPSPTSKSLYRRCGFGRSAEILESRNRALRKKKS